MKKASKIICLLLSLFSLMSYARTSDFLIKKQEFIEQKRTCNPVGFLEHYKFTRRNIDDLKFFLQKTIDVMAGENIYSVIESLDHHFVGGETPPKKLFAPTVSGFIRYTYLFKEAEGQIPCIFAYYGSYFERRAHKYWDFVSIDIPSDFKGVSTQFLDQDFEDFQLIFDKKFILEDIDVHNQHLYSSIIYLERELKEPENIKAIQDKCYGVYVFHKTEKGVPLRFTFCVNRENYHENDKYPYNFGRLAIERLN